jgi:hypothetical protein
VNTCQLPGDITPHRGLLFSVKLCGLGRLARTGRLAGHACLRPLQPRHGPTARETPFAPPSRPIRPPAQGRRRRKAGGRHPVGPTMKRLGSWPGLDAHPGPGGDVPRRPRRFHARGAPRGPAYNEGVTSSAKRDPLSSEPRLDNLQPGPFYFRPGPRPPGRRFPRIAR